MGYLTEKKESRSERSRSVEKKVQKIRKENRSEGHKESLDDNEGRRSLDEEVRSLEEEVRQYDRRGLGRMKRCEEVSKG